MTCGRSTVDLRPFEEICDKTSSLYPNFQTRNRVKKNKETGAEQQHKQKSRNNRIKHRRTFRLSMHRRYGTNGGDKMSGNVHNAIIVGVNGPEDNTEGKYEGVSTKRRAIHGINSKCKFIVVVIFGFPRVFQLNSAETWIDVTLGFISDQ